MISLGWTIALFQEVTEKIVPENIKQILTLMTKNALRLITEENVNGLQKMIGPEAVMGTICSDVIYLTKTKGKDFKKRISEFKEAALKDYHSLLKSELRLDFNYVVDASAKPTDILQNNDIIVRHDCEWGFLFRQKNKSWLLKGVFILPK